MAETLTLRGTLEGHEGWVTAIATPMSQPNSDILLSASRDKTVIMWKLTRDEVRLLRRTLGRGGRGARGWTIGPSLQPRGCRKSSSSRPPGRRDEEARAELRTALLAPLGCEENRLLTPRVPQSIESFFSPRRSRSDTHSGVLGDTRTTSRTSSSPATDSSPSPAPGTTP